MLKDVLVKIKSTLYGDLNYSVYEPEKIDDPFVDKIDWNPVRLGSANFRTHKLYKVDEINQVYKPTIIMRLFVTVFIIIGLFLVVNYFVNNNHQISVLIGGVIFIAIDLILIWQTQSKEGFDGLNKLFYQGFGKNNKKIGFSDIHAVQLLTKMGKISGDSEGYSSDRYFRAYELNLVLNDTKRVYVMGYVDLMQAITDAEKISMLVGAPLWKAIGENDGDN